MMMAMLRVLRRQLMREWLVYVRQLRMVVNACLFFLMVMVFFPLTLPASTDLLRLMLPGLVWIEVLLAILLSSERMFSQDHEDGVMEQWLLSGVPMSLFILAKICIQWVITIVPLLLLCPFLAFLFELTGYETCVLMFSLFCGTPAILCLSALAAILGTGLKQQGMLMALILLPLTIPIMIFGSAAVTAAMQGMPSIGYFAILLALSLVTLCFLPFAIAGVARISFVS
jgi:heme exporter protein B